MKKTWSLEVLGKFSELTTHVVAMVVGRRCPGLGREWKWGRITITCFTIIAIFWYPGARLAWSILWCQYWTVLPTMRVRLFGSVCEEGKVRATRKWKVMYK